MKQIFIATICLWGFSIFSADLPSAKQYVYLIDTWQQWFYKHTDIASNNLIFLTINPHLIFQYLKKEGCRMQSRNIYYYKIPSSAMGSVAAFYHYKNRIKICDWKKYRENLTCNQEQRSHLDFEGGVGFTSLHDEQEEKKMLFSPFKKIIIINDKSIHIAGNILRSWKTGKEDKVKSISL